MTVAYAFDTEFLEDGKTIELISIGIVAEDGREYYAVNADMPIHRIREHKWLMENVVPTLPTKEIYVKHRDSSLIVIDDAHPSVKPYGDIRDEVYAFLTHGGQEPKLWAFYGAYDHVAFAQFWGPMAELPKPMPMRTNDVAQALDAYNGWQHRPFQDPDTVHNALDDARHVMRTLEYIQDAAKPLWILEEANKLAKEGLLG